MTSRLSFRTSSRRQALSLHGLDESCIQRYVEDIERAKERAFFVARARTLLHGATPLTFTTRRPSMHPWERLGTVTLPDGDELTLRRRGEEYSLQLANFELMNSRQHDSEEQLATLALDARASLAGTHVLVGGLGMGYTLRAALDRLPADARVTDS